MSKTKYIKVSVSDRLPETSGTYLTFSSLGVKMQSYFNRLKFEGWLDPKYWLEEVPDYDEEMREMLGRIQDLDILPEEIEDELSLLLKKLKS